MTREDLIRRGDALDACSFETFECYQARKMIRELPSADRQKGEWVKKNRADDDGYWTWAECSKCGAKPLLNRWNRQEDLSNFCPNCGAKMDK